MKATHPLTDFRGLNDWVEVFRSGTHIAGNGVERAWTNDELDQMVANHNAATAAPIVIGHPQVNDPAYGWVDQLKRAGNSLLAKFRDVHAEFAKAAEGGAYRKRSVRIYKTPENTFAIEHVGFLGAKRPAIALDALNYSARASGEVFDFEADWFVPSVMARMMRRLRDAWIEKFGTDEADKVLPDYDITSLNDYANTALNNPEPDDSPTGVTPAPAFSSHDLSTGDPAMTGKTQADIEAAVAAERTRLQTEFAAGEKTLKQQLDAERRQRLSGEFSAFIKDTHLTPAQAEGAVDFMLQLSGSGDAQFEFAAGEQKIKKTPLQWFKDFVAAIPQQVPTDESDAGHRETASADFAAPAGYAVDSDQLALHRKAKDYQAAHPGTDYAAAITAVNK